MDFSPYRKKGHPSFGFESRKYFPVMIVLGLLLLGFLSFLAVQALFFSEEGTAVTSKFQKTEGSVVESQISGIEVWSLLSDGEDITEGDKVRVLSGPASVLTLKNGSTLTLASGSEVLIKNTKTTEEGAFFGEIVVSSGPVSFQGKGSVDETKSFLLWIDENHYIKAENGAFVIQDGMVHVIKGEGISIIEKNTSGKISNQKTIGVGQSLIISSFSVQATEESMKYLPLYAAISGAAPASSPYAVSGSLVPPVLTSFNFQGSAILVSDPLQKIEGTVGEDAVKVIVSFSNGTTTSDQEITPENKKWSFIASPTYDTMVNGINTYKIYAENAKKERSAATVLVLQYDPKGENVFDTQGGELMITSPNQGKNGVITGNVITLVGTAPKQAAKIIVTNKQFQNPYVLQKFVAGSGSWKYFTADLPAGTYSYSVEAVDANGKSLGVKTISLTIVGETPKASVSPTASQIPAKVSTAPAATSASTPLPKPSVTTAPTINSSTREAQR